MSRFQKTRRLWVSAVALAMICMGCASLFPKPEAPPPPVAPPPRVESAPLPQKTQPAPPKPEPPPQQASPLPEKPAPIRPKPVPPPPIQAPPEAEPTKAPYIHRVRWNGETLSMIAAWYTGDWKNWKTLAQANPQIRPNRIHEGNEITIPESLLKTRDPMPKEFVDRFYSKAKKEKPQDKPQPNQGQDEEPKLFGPKKYPNR